MVKEVVWRNGGVDLARTVVDLLLNLLEPFLRDGGEVMSFGEIMPDKPVVVLHTALFPGMVGFAHDHGTGLLSLLSATPTTPTSHD